MLLTPTNHHRGFVDCPSSVCLYHLFPFCFSCGGGVGLNASTLEILLFLSSLLVFLLRESADLKSPIYQVSRNDSRGGMVVNTNLGQEVHDVGSALPFSTFFTGKKFSTVLTLNCCLGFILALISLTLDEYQHLFQVLKAAHRTDREAVELPLPNSRSSVS